MEVLELQGSDMLKHNSHISYLLDFYRSLPKDEFPQFVEFAKKKVSFFFWLHVHV